MSHQIKLATQELKELVKQIAYKDELLKDIKASNPAIEKLQNLIKESQEEIKALLAANLDYFTIEQEKKELVKELNQGAKAAVKGTGFKKADLTAFMKADIKGASIKVVEKGQLFSSLMSQTK